MERRQLLFAACLGPAALALGPLPALASTQGSTFLQIPGHTASGSFEIASYTPGTRGEVDMVFTDGPRVAARFGPNAVSRIAQAAAGDRISIVYTGFNGQDSIATTWSLNQLTAAGARAHFDANGLAADVSALVGGAQYPGAGLAAMIVAALSAGSTVRQSPANRLQAVVSTRPVGGSFAFGLDVTVRNA